MAEKKPEWVKMKPAELEKIIVDLAKQGESPAKIGLILRDKHGIPKAKVLGKRISKILKEAKIEFKSEEKEIDEKLDQLKTHLAKNKHDYPAQRSLTKNLWRSHNLKKKKN